MRALLPKFLETVKLPLAGGNIRGKTRPPAYKNDQTLNLKNFLPIIFFYSPSRDEKRRPIIIDEKRWTVSETRRGTRFSLFSQIH